MCPGMASWDWTTHADTVSHMHMQDLSLSLFFIGISNRQVTPAMEILLEIMLE